MKYVCSTCGAVLPVDRDVDDDRVVEVVISRHRFEECPGDFPSDDTAPKAKGHQAAS